VRTATASLGATVNESAVAAVVFAGVGIDTLASEGPVLPPGVIRGDRQDAAAREVIRLQAVRLLTAGTGGHVEVRPVSARLRRRSSGDLARLVYGWRVLIGDAAGRELVESMVGIVLYGAGISRLPGTIGASFDSAIGRQSDRLVTEIRASMSEPLTLWLRRERGLLAVLRHHDARLAAPLLQRGLFDRRAERLAAMQQAAIDAAVADSHRRLEQLAACAAARVAACELAFAVLID
jgi:hypothetical protein